MAHWQWWWYFTLNLLMVLTRDNLSKHPATNRRGNRAHVAHKMDGRWDMYTLHYPLTTVTAMTAEHGQNKETMAPVWNLYCDIIYSLYNQVELHRMHVNWHNILGYKMKVPVHVQNYGFYRFCNLWVHKCMHLLFWILCRTERWKTRSLGVHLGLNHKTSGTWSRLVLNKPVWLSRVHCDRSHDTCTSMDTSSTWWF